VPIEEKLKNGRVAVLDYYVEADIPTLHGLLNDVIEDGMTYPQLEKLTLDGFKAYFLPAAAFVTKDKQSGEILGTFYIKPNYPGRCSHICNAGFIVAKTARNLGVGNFMARCYLKLAPDLGYRASMFNLVFISNVPSIRLWESLGFKRTGTVPNAGLLKDGKYHDANQYYYDFTNPNFSNHH